LPDFLGFSCFIELQTALKFVKGKKFMDDKKHPFTSHVPYLYFQEFIFDFFYPFTLFLIKKKVQYYIG